MNRTNWTDLLYTDAPGRRLLSRPNCRSCSGGISGIFHVAQDIRRTGSSRMMHEARADLTMLLGCIYLPDCRGRALVIGCPHAT